MAETLQHCYDQGLHAALRDEPKASCRYRAPAKRAHWLSGWHDGINQRQPKPGQQQRETGRKALAALRQTLSRSDAT